MALIGLILQRAFEQGIEQVQSGKLPMLAKGGFYSMMTVVSYMAVGYLSNIDKRFESIEQSLKENSARQTLDISRHDQILSNHELRLGKLEMISRAKLKGEHK